MPLGKFSFASYTEKDRTEKVDKGFVKYGKDNDFPDYLNNLYLTSSTHHALCDSISYMVAGGDIETKQTSTLVAIQKYGLNALKGLLAFDLKVHGSFAYEIIKDRKGDVFSVEHLPMCNLRPQEVNEDGEIENWFYCEDWQDRKLVNIAKEIPIPVYNPESKEAKSIVVCKTPTPDSYYFSKPDYIGSLNYIELEKEISTFHVNNIKNGFFPSAFLIWKNGIPTREERNTHMAQIESELAGAQNAGKIVNLYADSAEQAPDIHSFDTNDADKMYDFLASETTDKIMIGHRVTTPALFGVKTAGQLGGTQELETGSVLFESTVIEPMRDILEKGIETALKAMGVTEEINIPSNNPFIPNSVKKTLESTEIQSIIDVIGRVGTDLTPIQAEGILGIMGIETETIKTLFNTIHPLDEFHASIEDDLDGWVCIDDEDSEGEAGDFDFEKELNEASMKFASTGTARPNAKSEQDVEKDGVKYKVRYYYNQKEGGGKHREFCEKMMRANKLYRKEDIMRMSTIQVNSSYTNKEGRTIGWGPNGALTYDVWLWKGGGNCHHRWYRKIFVAEGANVDVNSPNAQVISTTKARSKGVNIETNDSKVSVAPIDMPNQGFLASAIQKLNDIKNSLKW